MRKIYLIATLCAALILTGAGCINFGGGSAQGPLGMFRSSDKGETWQQINNYPTAKGVVSLAGLKVYDVHKDPSDINAYYLATRGQGLYYTYNNGETWQAVGELGGMFVYALAVDTKDKCTIYVSDGQHIYKTTDCTRSWQLVYTEERPSQRLVALAVDYGNASAIYAAEANGEILMSGDGGRSWRAIQRFGFEIKTLVADPMHPKRLYAAAYRDGLWRSDDGGTSWIDLGGGLNNFSDAKNYYRLVLNPAQADSVFWISKYGILRSDDAGVTWHEMKLLTPPGSVNIYGFGINPSNQREMYYTGTILGEKNVHVRSTFYKTSDGGVNWVTKKLPTNTIPIIMWVHPKNNSTIFMGFTVLDK